MSERIGDFRDVALRLPEEDVAQQAARCMDCGIPFCHGCGCPVTNMIPEFNDHVYRGRWSDALRILLATNPFPEFTGRICPAPCETSCVLGINDDPVTIREIELAVIEHGFEAGLVLAQPPSRRREQAVAVLGSGPAGLAAAEYLNREGCSVTVYEHDPRPGGILRYGIPDFKLEKWVVDRRIRLMEEEGIRFECSVRAGEDISHRYLQDRFQAIVLTGGAREPRELPAPGRDLGGIHQAMDFLTQQNLINANDPLPPGRERIDAQGRHVVVIGGGDTGSDCVGTSRRQGAASILQLEILPEPPPERAPETPWPLWPLRRRDSSSHKEGCERRWSVTTERFTGKDGRVCALEGAEVEWVAAGEGARPAPVKKPGTEFTAKTDLVLLAMGFVGPGRNALVENMGIALDNRGFILRDDAHMTSEPGVFVAGDMTQGALLVVRAIQDGKIVAGNVLSYLDHAD